MSTNDRDLWTEISSVNSGFRELNYLTYAIYSFEKFEWYEQVSSQRGTPPSEQELNEWISQITGTRIKVWGESAARTFDAAARTYLKDEIDKRCQEAAQNGVISRIKEEMANFKTTLESSTKDVRKSSSFPTVLFISLVTAILTPIILGLAIVGVRAADLWPTPSQIEHFFNPERQTEPTKDSPAKDPKANDADATKKALGK
jgi:hypothetical protein